MLLVNILQEHIESKFMMMIGNRSKYHHKTCRLPSEVIMKLILTAEWFSNCCLLLPFQEIGVTLFSYPLQSEY